MKVSQFFATDNICFLGNDIGVDPRVHFIPHHRKTVPPCEERVWF